MPDQWGTHTCRAPGCTIVIGKSKLLCPGHWSRVPKVLRDRLADRFRRWERGEETFAGVRPVIKELRDAQQACIDSITQEGSP